MSLNRNYNKYLPFGLSVFLLAADQITKWLVVLKIPLYTIGWQMWGDFLRIIHVRNLGVAFSIGRDFPEFARRLFFILLPLIFVVFLLIYYFKDNTITKVQAWTIAGIVGGGMGNLTDRIFRPTGVVDFIDVKFYGLFGWERFPTFNVADSSVVVCGFLLAASFIIEEKRSRKQEKLSE